MIAIVSLIFILLLSFIMTRIATIALVHTGLSKQSAKFQARSAFTGVGFTTSEAENVINNPVRRKIIMMLMLVGNAGIVTGVASLIIGFTGLESDQSTWIRVVILVAGIMLLWFFTQSKWVDKHLARIINKFLKKHTRLNVVDYSSLLQLAGEYTITEMGIEGDHWLCNRKLRNTKLTDEGIIILAIVRKDGEFIGAPQADTRILEYDKLIIYGRASVLKKLETRHKGFMGTIEHHDIAEEQKHIIEKEEKHEKAEKEGKKQERKMKKFGEKG
ncbi:MAG: TrkA C-terminal domain-containing protein [Bacteroidota bacterium]